MIGSAGAADKKSAALLFYDLPVSPVREDPSPKSA